MTTVESDRTEGAGYREYQDQKRMLLDKIRVRGPLKSQVADLRQYLNRLRERRALDEAVAREQIQQLADALTSAGAREACPEALADLRELWAEVAR